ncbi:response regulator transcription factor [Luteococcus sp. Sow4_B9]|uniref:response regulator transcription factor n=1 Tax=Luteococcus sp. Sow4_B9 TaxID=3438792 RepID=UPI003F959838
MARAPIKVASCDNDALVRRAITMYIEHAPSLELVGSMSSGREVLDFVSNNTLDVLLLDVRMPEPDGFAVAERIERMGRPCRVIYLTSYLEERVTRDVMSGRVQGLLNKDVDPAVLTKAVHVVHEGLTVLHPDALTATPRASHSHSPNPSSLATNEREEEVLRLLFLGQSNAAIAKSLHLSESSVKAVLATLMARANVTNRTALVIAAMDQQV